MHPNGRVPRSCGAHQVAFISPFIINTLPSVGVGSLVVDEIDAKNPGHFAALEQYRSAGRWELLPNGSGHGGPWPRDGARG